MLNEIGELSGFLWHLLDEKGPQSLAQLKKLTGKDEFTLTAAIGWLAREDKLEITKSARAVKISLK